jgi:CRISPR system Cascade subunit CasA
VKSANLLCVPWIPGHSRLGPVLIKPHDVTRELAQNPILDLAWPRADFRIACLEMLTGLLTTACPPEDEAAWDEWWHHPPSPETLEAKFAPLAHAFVLDGDGPRFCQDLEDFPGEPLPVERLLIDAPGENTVKRNTDLLVKRDRIPLLGRPAAAMALYTLQAFAPSGGAGHRTSLRGGGPLTTLVRPSRYDAKHRTLWHLLWANVPYGQAAKPDELPKIFPWLAPTRRSEGGTGTVLGGEQAHPLQAFWGMPRRIRLDIRAAQPGEVCGITGEPGAMVVTGFRTRPWGVSYVDAAHFHPLTPSYKPKAGDLPLPVHPQPDGIGYRDWHRLIEAGNLTWPATAVSTYLGRKPRGSAGARFAEEARLLIGGYDMDNMKARSFLEAEMPLFLIDDDALRLKFLSSSHKLAEAATYVSNLLRGAIRNALLIEESERTTVDDARQRFFEITTGAFWAMLRAALDDNAFRSADESEAETARAATAERWRLTLRDRALGVFDETAPLDPLAPNAAGTIRDGQWKPPPVVEARRNLSFGLNGYGKAGLTLFTLLSLELPEKKPAKPKPEKPKPDKAKKAARNG